jgi:hypothetical protein
VLQKLLFLLTRDHGPNQLAMRRVQESARINKHVDDLAPIQLGRHRFNIDGEVSVRLSPLHPRSLVWWKRDFASVDRVTGREGTTPAARRFPTGLQRIDWVPVAVNGTLDDEIHDAERASQDSRGGM